MEYAEALKKVRADKPKDSFMVIQLNGEDKLIMPHKDGVAFLEAMTNSEKFSNRWNDSNTKIEPLEQGYITTSSLSRQEYERYKVAALLNISIYDVKELESKQPS